MATSCSCLKLCSVVVAFANLGLGSYMLYDGILKVTQYLNNTENVPIGVIIVDFQIASFLLFVGLLLLFGIIKDREKLISLYLLLSSLIWFVITMLAVSYMIFYNTTQLGGTTLVEDDIDIIDNGIENNSSIVVLVPGEVVPSVAPKPKKPVPLEKAVGFSLGLVAIWCGQLGVYKFHDQVIEKNVINAGESYVSSAVHHS